MTNNTKIPSTLLVQGQVVIFSQFYPFVVKFTISGFPKLKTDLKPKWEGVFASAYDVFEERFIQKAQVQLTYIIWGGNEVMLVIEKGFNQVYVLEKFLITILVKILLKNTRFLHLLYL